VDGPPWISEKDGDAVLDVFVQPRARVDTIVGVHGRALRVKVSEPPVDDRANRALEGLLAGIAGVPKSRVAVVSGASSRHKRVRITGVRAAEAVAAIERARA
jgi:uncharacterized protein (TIGR00251 family)